MADKSTDIVPIATAVVIEDVPLSPIVSLQQSLEAWDQFQQIVKGRMKEGYHYDTIPGTQKPSLLDPGGDLLMKMYGLTDVDPNDAARGYELLKVTEDWDMTPPLFDYTVACTLYNVRTGKAVRRELASCNSWEDRYRWRERKRTCPRCGSDAIIKGKEDFGGGWLCWAKKGGCGAKFPDGAQAIEGQPTGREPNADVANQKNTILQIAQKRSKLRAVRAATLAGEMFTQDMEDIAHREPTEERKAEPGEKRQPPQTAVKAPEKSETTETADRRPANPALGAIETDKFIVSEVKHGSKFQLGKDGKPDKRKKKIEYLEVKSGDWRGFCFDKQYFGVIDSSPGKQIEVTVERTAGDRSAYWKITQVNAAWNGGAEPKAQAAENDDELEQWFADESKSYISAVTPEPSPKVDAASLPLSTVLQDTLFKLASQFGFTPASFTSVLQLPQFGVVALSQLPASKVDDLAKYLMEHKQS
jgi:hypothetical protein